VTTPRRGALCVLVAVALGGCGEGEDPPAAATPKPTRQPDRRATAKPAEQAIREVANAYLKASSRGVHVRLYAIDEDGRWGIARSKQRRER
jgi:hypothetical protein